METIALTDEQCAAIEGKWAVPVVVGATRCVVVREDVLQRLTEAAINYDELTPRQMAAIALRAMDDEPESHRGLYDDLVPR